MEREKCLGWGSRDLAVGPGGSPDPSEPLSSCLADTVGMHWCKCPEPWPWRGRPGLQPVALQPRAQSPAVTDSSVTPRESQRQLKPLSLAGGRQFIRGQASFQEKGKHRQGAILGIIRPGSGLLGLQRLPRMGGSAWGGAGTIRPLTICSSPSCSLLTAEGPSAQATRTVARDRLGRGPEVPRAPDRELGP